MSDSVENGKHGLPAGAVLPLDPIGVPDAAKLIGRRPGFLYRRVLLKRLRAWRVDTSIVLSRADVLALVVVTGPEETGHERAVRELLARGLG